MLTKSDLKEINKLFQTNIKPAIDEIKAVNTHNSRIEMKLIDMEEKFERNLKQWKSEIFDKIDQLVSSLKPTREEQTVISGKVSEHSDTLESYGKRIDKLEEVLQPQNP